MAEDFEIDICIQCIALFGKSSSYIPKYVLIHRLFTTLTVQHQQILVSIQKHPFQNYDIINFRILLMFYQTQYFFLILSSLFSDIIFFIIRTD